MLTMEILQKVGQFLDQNPEKVSPNDIYKLIVNSKEERGTWTDVSSEVDSIFSRDSRRGITVRYVKRSGETCVVLF